VADEVFRVVLPDGQEFAWHNTLEALREEYPRARISGILGLDKTGQGFWTEYEGKGSEEVQYMAMTVAQLREEHQKRGISEPDGAKKADLVASLEANDSGEVFDASKVVAEEKVPSKKVEKAATPPPTPNAASQLETPTITVTPVEPVE